MAFPYGFLPRRLQCLPLGLLLLLAGACGASANLNVPDSTVPPRAGQVHIAKAAATGPVANAAPTPVLPSDLSLLTLVNKQRPLAPLDYVPPDLVRIPSAYVSSQAEQRLRLPAEEALTQMLEAATRAGLGIKVNSAYRSYQYQVAVFNSEVAANGCTQALRESAVPGRSEHQLGLAVDLTSAGMGWGLHQSFAQTPEGRWLAMNAAKYGFVLSYPDGKEGITGYEYEPWHYRYVTIPVAQAILASGKTSTQFLASLGSASAENVTVPPPGSPPVPVTCAQG